MQTPRRMQSKREQILQVLRDSLASGDYPPGSILPSENELGEVWGIGRNTIREAIYVLVQEGRLDRVQGKGTIVLAQPEKSTLRTCLLMVKARGDLYENQAKSLQTNLQENGVLPMLFSVSAGREVDHDVEMAADSLSYALEHKVDGIIADGSSIGWVTRRIEESGLTIPVVGINTVALPERIQAHSVQTDIYRGVQMATEHLRALGHERIVLVTHKNLFIHNQAELESIQGLYGDVLRGYRDAMTGLKPVYHYVRYEFLDHGEIATFKALLSEPNRPTAVLAIGDYRAKVIIDLARQMGLSTPDDLAVVGFYNTPWATHTSPAITSVDVNCEEIAELAVDCLFGKLAAKTPKGRHQHIMLEPRLVVRESCGASAAKNADRDADVRQPSTG